MAARQGRATAGKNSLLAVSDCGLCVVTRLKLVIPLQHK